MAGEAPFRGFGDQFREAITFAQEMGAPPDEEARVTFLFPSQLVYNTEDPSVDARGTPFDPETTVQRVNPDPVRVPCAITYFDDQGEITNFGIVAPTRIRVELLDIHYVQVKDAVAVVAGGDRYVYRRTEPPSGLFDVGIYVMHFHAEQET